MTAIRLSEAPAQDLRRPRLSQSTLSTRGPLAAALCAVSVTGASAWNCAPHFDIPGPGRFATDHNGLALQPTCMYPDGREHHVFVIGDWGGVVYAPGMNPVPADRRSKRFPAHHRDFVKGADDVAQINVARQMLNMSTSRRVDYVLNVGDNFYWGGVNVACGLPVTAHAKTGQWGPIFENMYSGGGLDNVPWLGVLGNHDYGGYQFNQGWDQSIAYTWAPKEVGSSGRWMTPAQYYMSQVEYADFTVDYFFVDTNVFDAMDPNSDPGHNICGLDQNQDATCGAMGPSSVWDCPKWFAKLWGTQMLWLEDKLNQSTADWQIIVTHFPPDWGIDEWSYLTKKYGIDLYIAGHKHVQTVYGPKDPWNLLPGTALLVSGGGGGITSEAVPDAQGHDDMYGFMDLTLTKEYIQIDAISHGGERRTRTKMAPRPRNWHPKSTAAADERLPQLSVDNAMASGKALAKQAGFDLKNEDDSVHVDTAGAAENASSSNATHAQHSKPHKKHEGSKHDKDGNHTKAAHQDSKHKKDGNHTKAENHSENHEEKKHADQGNNDGKAQEKDKQHDHDAKSGDSKAKEVETDPMLAMALGTAAPKSDEQDAPLRFA